MKPMKWAPIAPAESHQSAAEREGLQPVARRILAERHRSALVFANCPQHPTPRTASEPLQRHINDPDNDRDERQIGKVVELRHRRETVEGTRNERDAEGAAGQLLALRARSWTTTATAVSR